ncbi:Stp1/IreP family PP2C-type Ser/Thr phosphatase [Metabacillus sp. GX 13764]|uniref:Stp1/IreP family PP2C-type Ser/Thr phosphatase n=1 Tax=Metabacillus kandeliae TaxID=2900151 RepID=UPI001E4725C9|nr:Stp1/IreP family PP2C-type Ser/Thr phosphatase [Metabacillus kandeliae]
MNTAFLTDRGRVRSHNEDCVGIFTHHTGAVFAVIADGMGGHLAGEVASEMALSAFKKEWSETEEFTSPDEAESWLKHQSAQVNKRIFEHALTHPECKGMGTTFVGVICTNSFATIGHIGDSRCYLYNLDGFKQLTNDHSLVHELVRSGQISKEDAEHHPRKNILLRALGTEMEVQMDVKSICVEPSDRILLCSDGLSDKLNDPQLLAILKDRKSVNEIAEKLIEAANQNGGEDNISVAIIQLPPDPEEGDEAC